MISTARIHQPVSGARSALRILAVALLAVTLVARSANAQTFKVLYGFFKGPPDGMSPNGELVRDANGNLYGTTSQGGAFGAGTVFKIDKLGNESVLYSFAGGLDGDTPAAGLVRDSEGNLYGTTAGGGYYPDCGAPFGGSCGTVFKIDSNGNHTVLYLFGAMPDGNSPVAPLLLDAAGNLYGTTSSGGDNNCNPGFGCGTVFKLNKNGLETILHTFAGIERKDGAFPYTGLISDASGNFYGTTNNGGAPGCGDGCGTVFRLDKFGTETVLHRFAGWTDGNLPDTGIIRDLNGNIYGMTSQGGGPGGDGAVFRLNKYGRETILHDFDFYSRFPGGSLLLDSEGNLYGTTVEGGTSYSGTVFKLDKTGHYIVLHNFDGRYGGGLPHSTLIMDAAGNLYGTASSPGVVFKITP